MPARPGEDVAVNMPCISIVSPCLNASHYLAQTIESLREQSAIRDGRVELQHIVIDGASTDGTRDLVANYPGIEFVSEPDSGMYDALGKGLLRARGDIVGYLNAGDILFPWAFDVLSEVFKTAEVDWVTGYSSHINARHQVTACWKPPRYRREFVLNGYYADPRYPFAIQQESTFWSGQMNARIDHKKLRTFKLAGDYFIWSEFAKHVELHSAMSPLGAFRIHKGQLSERRDEYLAEAISTVRPPTRKEKFTAWWETRCNPLIRGFLWNYTLGKSPAKIFDYDHSSEKWIGR